MEARAPVNQPPPKNGPQANFKRTVKRKQPQHSADIVFTKGATIQTIPSFSKLLKGVTECIIGLQYVWEYRSPSKSVPPHYQCKLCAVSRLQHDMLAHVKGWKHSYRYLKKVHPDKITHEEEEAVKDPAVRKAIKEVAASVEKTEGRGQLKVILREPFEVLAFKGLRSAIPKVMPPPAPGMGLQGPPFGEPVGPRFSDQRFPPQDGPFFDCPAGEYRDLSFGDYSSRQNVNDSGMDRRPFPANVGQSSAGDGFGPGNRRDGYGRSGRLDAMPNRMYTDDYRSSKTDRPMGRPMDMPMERQGLVGTAPESGNQPNALLTYLDTFRIENESDAQLVLKVTQKLTDLLMEYRLRNVSAGSSLSSLSMSSTNFSSSSFNSTNFSSTPSRLTSSIERYSSSLSGPSRFSDGPSRFFK